MSDAHEFSPLDGASASPPHVPVVAERVRELVGARPGGTVVDGTFGAGGHARLIAPDLAGQGMYIGVDRDPHVAARFAAFADEFAQLGTRFLGEPFPDAFARLHAEEVSADAVILDIGVSSMQLDELDRGFAYAHDAPLDMRMDPSSGRTAADIVGSASDVELERILREFGEERHARRIARSIVRRRDIEPILRTGQLVEAIRAGLPGGGRVLKGGHPAKRTFQALRIEVNDELGMLDRGLDAAFELLVPGGRLVVIAFQSLEDRMVKRRFERWIGRCTCPPGLPVCGCGSMSIAEPLTRGAEQAGDDEVAANPRSAPTRLRAVRRRAVPIPAGDASVDSGATRDALGEPAATSRPKRRPTGAARRSLPVALMHGLLRFVVRRISGSPRLRRLGIRTLVLAAAAVLLASAVGVIMLNNTVIRRSAELGELDQRRGELRTENAVLGAKGAQYSAPTRINAMARRIGMAPAAEMPVFIYLDQANQPTTPAMRRRIIIRERRLAAKREAAAASAAASDSASDSTKKADS